jgi:hypothetical protein
MLLVVQKVKVEVYQWWPVVSDELVNDKSFLQQNFKKEANFAAYRNQIHEHVRLV